MHDCLIVFNSGRYDCQQKNVFLKIDLFVIHFLHMNNSIFVYFLKKFIVEWRESLHPSV
jgi:hypothetical protein